VGDTRTPLLTLLISTAVGLLLTPALIRGWLGLPELGVTSGAWAAVASYLIALGWTARHLLRQHHALAPDAAFRSHLRIDRALLAKVLRIGLPTGLSMMTIAIAEISVLFLVNRFGSQATAAYGAVNQIVSYVQFPAISIAITASILGAHAIGAGRTHTLGAIARTGLLLNLVLTGSFVIAGYLFSRHVIGLFITDPAVVDLAQTLLHIMLWSSVIMGHVHGAVGPDARQRHGSGAHGPVDAGHRRHSGAGGLGAQRHLRAERHLGRLPGGLPVHAGDADGVLPAGLAQAPDPPAVNRLSPGR
jgi:Na+-driven multidrug efflux pump